MSTVVVFLEWIMLCLIGLLLYKLYITYLSSQTQPSKSQPKASQEPHSANQDAITVSKVHIKLSQKMPASSKQENVSTTVSEPLVSSKDSKPRAILTDYIDEFFSSESAKPKPVDLDLYRSTALTKQASEQTEVAREKTNQSIEAVPTLNELSEFDPEAFITVEDAAQIETSTGRVMSNKVVSAMLDEAKLIRAS